MSASEAEPVRQRITGPGSTRTSDSIVRDKDMQGRLLSALSFLADFPGPPCSFPRQSHSPPYSFLQYGLSSTWLGVPLVLTGYAAHSAVSSDAVWTLLLRMSFVE